MHDGNREGAKSLSENIAFDYWTYKENKYFNKLPAIEKLIDYPHSELIKLGQAPEGSIGERRRLSIGTDAGVNYA